MSCLIKVSRVSDLYFEFPITLKGLWFVYIFFKPLFLQNYGTFNKNN